MKREVPQDGEVFEMAYPFVRDTVTLCEGYGEEFTSKESPTWKPGIRMENVYPDDCEAVADGIGKQTITVVGTFKPGRFPRRVFFTRQWTDPDGKTFGKGACRITTINAFRSLTNGYRHEFKFAGVMYGHSPCIYGETSIEMLTAMIGKAAGVE